MEIIMNRAHPEARSGTHRDWINEPPRALATKPAQASPQRGEFLLDAGARLLVSDRQTYLPAGELDCMTIADGRLLPTLARFRSRWLSAVGAVAGGQSARLCLVANRPHPLHAFMMPGRHRGTARIMLEREHVCDRQVFELYARQYLLSETERQVLWQLAAGTEPKRIAQGHSVAESTVRSQIRSILAKSGEARGSAALPSGPR